MRLHRSDRNLGCFQQGQRFLADHTMLALCETFLYSGGTDRPPRSHACGVEGSRIKNIKHNDIGTKPLCQKRASKDGL